MDSSATRLLVARDEDGDIVGSLTLALFRIPTGLRAWVEDVVVDEAARGQGVGATLIMEALRLTPGAGARTVDLTSPPEREAAERLYWRLGFKLRDTSCGGRATACWGMVGSRRGPRWSGESAGRACSLAWPKLRAIPPPR